MKKKLDVSEAMQAFKANEKRYKYLSEMSDKMEEGFGGATFLLSLFNSTEFDDEEVDIIQNFNRLIDSNMECILMENERLKKIIVKE